MQADLDKIHALVIEGHTAEARTRLLRLAARPAARDHAAELARLACRAGLPGLGLRLLHPIVRPSARVRREASPVEKSEYALCLIKAGALEEGVALLDEVDPREAPEALMNRVSALVACWNYRDTIPLIERYLRTPRLSPYARLVARVNLAAALVYERRHREATPLLRELLYTASLRKFSLALSRAMELSAESFLAQGKIDRARSFLDEAGRRLPDGTSIDALFVRKFLAIASVIETGAGGRARAALRAVRDEAVARGHWETARDCDRVEAVARRDQKLVARVYFGTPHAHYRERLLADLGKGFRVPEEYVWKTGGDGKARGRVDLLTGEVSPAGKGLTPGSVLQRLLLALAADLYRPTRLAGIHARVYPDRFFNPVSSPRMIYDGIARLRAWLHEQRLPLAVEERDGFYSLRGEAPCELRFASPALLGKRYGLPLEALRRASPALPFSLGDAVSLLGIPRRTALRILREGCEEGSLERSGKGRGTKYRFCA